MYFYHEKNDSILDDSKSFQTCLFPNYEVRMHIPEVGVLQNGFQIGIDSSPSSCEAKPVEVSSAVHFGYM